MRAKPYSSYKPSGVDWLGDVPAHWEVKRGRYLLQVNPPSPRLRALRAGEEISFIPMDAVGAGGTLELNESRAIGDAGSGYTEFQNDDIIVAKITPCFENGKAAHARQLKNGVAYGTTELHVLRARPGTDAQFAFYSAISESFRKLGESEMYGAGGQKRVPPEFCKDYRFTRPPLPEQRAIAALLDRETGRIDTLVAKKRELIERLQEKRTALISHAVTRGLDPRAKLKPSGLPWLGDIPAHWRATKLRHYISILSGFAFPSAGFSHDESDVRLLRGVNVGVSMIRWDDTVYWPRTAGDGLDGFVLNEGTLVIGMDRPWITEGVRVAILSPADIPCLLLQRVAAIEPNRFLSRDFLFRILSSPMFVNYFTPEMTGVSVPHISPEQIGDFPIPIPPLPEQTAIADFLDTEAAKLNALVRKAEEAIERLQEYRTALITAAVTGKISVCGD